MKSFGQLLFLWMEDIKVNWTFCRDVCLTSPQSHFIIWAWAYHFPWIFLLLTPRIVAEMHVSDKVCLWNQSKSSQGFEAAEEMSNGPEVAKASTSLLLILFSIKVNVQLMLSNERLFLCWRNSPKTVKAVTVHTSVFSLSMYVIRKNARIHRCKKRKQHY